MGPSLPRAFIPCRCSLDAAVCFQQVHEFQRLAYTLKLGRHLSGRPSEVGRLSDVGTTHIGPKQSGRHAINQKDSKDTGILEMFYRF